MQAWAIHVYCKNTINTLTYGNLLKVELAPKTNLMLTFICDLQNRSHHGSNVS